MAHEVEIQHQAARQIIKLPREVQVKVKAKIDALAIDPRPSGCVKLSGERDAYRVRTGDYRIVYMVHDAINVVSVRRVAHRREVYR